MAYLTGFRDAWQLIRAVMTPKRLVNAGKNYASYLEGRWNNRTTHPGWPISVSIEPTTACNLGCPQCPSGLKSFTRPTGRMRLEGFKKVIDEVAPYSPFLTLYFQGEPYLNPAFTDMVRYAREKKMYVFTSSNAHFLDEKRAEETVRSGLSRMIISIDGITQETYEKYRVEGKLSSVIEGTQRLLAAKRKYKSKFPFVIWQFIVFKHNYHELPQIKKMAKEMGVDKLVIKSAQIYDVENAEEWLPEDPAYRRYAIVNGKAEIEKLPNRCWRLWSSSVITWDERVIPCCFDKDGKYTMGYLKTFSFQNIWNGPLYRDFRRQLWKGRQEIEICKNCSEGTKVWV